MREEILAILKKTDLSNAIAIVESIGKELRRMNSIRISKLNNGPLIEMERPDLIK